jgi:hypothetical protein
LKASFPTKQETAVGGVADLKRDHYRGSNLITIVAATSVEEGVCFKTATF